MDRSSRQKPRECEARERTRHQADLKPEPDQVEQRAALLGMPFEIRRYIRSIRSKRRRVSGQNSSGPQYSMRALREVRLQPCITSCRSPVSRPTACYRRLLRPDVRAEAQSGALAFEQSAPDKGPIVPELHWVSAGTGSARHCGRAIRQVCRFVVLLPRSEL